MNPALSTSLRLSLLAAPLLSFSLLGSESQPLRSKYRGFTIDESKVQNLPTLKECQMATREQIDMVCAVGLTTETLKFLQTVPFVLVPAATFPPTPGLYEGSTRTVKVSTRIPAIGHKPVLLHELLHAYHHQKLPDGNKNRAVLALYDKAKSSSLFASASHMMRTPGEFFACAATTYLFGVTAQEPFQRSKIQEAQPELFAHLKSMFGPGAGSYEGSLQRTTDTRANESTSSQP